MIILEVYQENLQKLVQENLQKRKEQLQRKSLYRCNICKDTGWILRTDEKGRVIASACECRKRNISKEQWKKTGINTESNLLTFKNFKEWNESSKIAKSTAIAYFNDFANIKNSRHNSIIFCGQPGSGKTHLAIALAINFIKKNLKVIYFPYRDVITKIKQNMLDSEYYKKFISKFETCDILLIDDLFKGKVNDSDVNIMFEIINYRYINNLPMIINSEFLIDRLLYFDEAIGSRIYEMCRDYLVQIKHDIKNNYRLR